MRRCILGAVSALLVVSLAAADQPIYSDPNIGSVALYLGSKLGDPRYQVKAKAIAFMANISDNPAVSYQLGQDLIASMMQVAMSDKETPAGEKKLLAEFRQQLTDFCKLVFAIEIMASTRNPEKAAFLVPLLPTDPKKFEEENGSFIRALFSRIPEEGGEQGEGKADARKAVLGVNCAIELYTALAWHYQPPKSEAFLRAALKNAEGLRDQDLQIAMLTLSAFIAGFIQPALAEETLVKLEGIGKACSDESQQKSIATIVQVARFINGIFKLGVVTGEQVTIADIEGYRKFGLRRLKPQHLPEKEKQVDALAEKLLAQAQSKDDGERAMAMMGAWVLLAYDRQAAVEKIIRAVADLGADDKSSVSTVLTVLAIDLAGRVNLDLCQNLIRSFVERIFRNDLADNPANDLWTFLMLIATSSSSQPYVTEETVDFARMTAEKKVNLPGDQAAIYNVLSYLTHDESKRKDLQTGADKLVDKLIGDGAEDAWKLVVALTADSAAFDPARAQIWADRFVKLSAGWGQEEKDERFEFLFANLRSRLSGVQQKEVLDLGRGE